MTGLPWDASYREGPAPWDFGGPQPAVVEAAGRFTGDVLDVGCGSGENALHLASLGLRVLGVDVAETALRRARRMAGERGLDAEFATADALRLERLGRGFDTVLDCGLFHTFDADERVRYVKSLEAVTKGTLFILCFSDEGENTGPHPVKREALTAPFGRGWRVKTIEKARVRTRFHDENGAPAWFATIEREPSDE
ncbi:class I SAM-dependent methyltransferase [Amycolatopsis orientalis]|uniref:class I SAM-dependent methyltransferase n=1 Tax=Amycolatopsis orientalis TaxID=31958 RepID=UPI00056C01F8|nr:class I SAM-dependent methyltransferase [Amycolatopsis orientalis]